MKTITSNMSMKELRATYYIIKKLYYATNEIGDR